MTTNAKVLIADDDPSIVRALSARCEKLGLEVQTAKNGLQAILRASRNPPRLIILDLNMPEADGFRVCEWLLDAKRPPVDVIVLTARSDIETLDRCDSLGAFYVPKGADTWEMMQAILSDVLELEDGVLASFAPSKSDQTGRLLRDTVRNKVLIVEDDADLAEALARRFRKCGAVTLVAPDGIIGYRIAMKERPDAIVTDYMMPDGGGHYMIWRLKSTEATKRIPVIVISGQGRDADRSTPLDHETHGHGGPVKFFQKPLDIDALLKELSQHCAIQYTPFEAAG
jgi:CheY-like chemotaxis protein